MQATAITTERVIDTLDEVSRLHAVRRDADAALFELAAVFADQHSGDHLVPATSSVPGSERAVQVGGTSTPRIAEFACAELGARMQMSPVSARRLVADALDVRHRLPQIWSRVVAREARVSNARPVATRTRHLSTEAAAYVDAAMADHVDGSLPWGRFETRLDRQGRRRRPGGRGGAGGRRVAEQFAKRTRSSRGGDRGVLRAVHRRGDRPAGGDDRVPGRRVEGVRGRATSRTCAGSRPSRCWPTRSGPSSCSPRSPPCARDPSRRARRSTASPTAEPDATSRAHLDEPEARPDPFAGPRAGRRAGPDGRVRPAGRVHPAGDCLTGSPPDDSGPRPRPTWRPTRRSPSTGRGCCPH